MSKCVSLLLLLLMATVHAQSQCSLASNSSKCDDFTDCHWCPSFPGSKGLCEPKSEPCPVCAGLPSYFMSCAPFGGAKSTCCDGRYTESMRSMCSHPQLEPNGRCQSTVHPPLTLGAITPPVFPTAFSARIHEVLHSGATREVADCDLHWDASKNMTSYRRCGWDATQEQLVMKFLDDKYGPRSVVYHIYGYGPFGNKCEFYCDVQGSLQCNLQESLCQYDYMAHAKFDSNTTLNGTAANVFKWGDKLGPINMNKLSLYVNAATNAPMWMHRDEQAVMKLGTIDTNYSNFTAGSPDPSAFDVPGIDRCPIGDEGTQCKNGETLEEHMLRWRLGQN